MGRGEPDPRDGLRARRALALGTVATAAVVGAGGLLPVEGPAVRLGAVAFLGAGAAALAGPYLGTGPRPAARALAGAAGLAAGLTLAALLAAGPALPALAAGLALGGFLLFAAGLAGAAAAVVGAGPAAGGAALVAVLCVASFHAGDPFLEWNGPNTFSPAAMTVLHAMNPLSGAAGDALQLDWLRFPVLYRGFPGSGGEGLTAAPYYSFRYFPWWGTALLHGGTGAALLALRSGSFPFRRRAGAPTLAS